MYNDEENKRETEKKEEESLKDKVIGIAILLAVAAVFIGFIVITVMNIGEIMRAILAWLGFLGAVAALVGGYIVCKNTSSTFGKIVTIIAALFIASGIYGCAGGFNE